MPTTKILFWNKLLQILGLKIRVDDLRSKTHELLYFAKRTVILKLLMFTNGLSVSLIFWDRLECNFWKHNMRSTYSSNTYCTWSIAPLLYTHTSCHVLHVHPFRSTKFLCQFEEQSVIIAVKIKGWTTLWNKNRTFNKPRFTNAYLFPFCYK